MKFDFGSLKRTVAGVCACAALLLAGTGLEAFAQKPYKEQQKTERRDLRQQQRYERRSSGTSRSLRREHKAERRDLKAEHKAERRDYKQTRRSARPGYYSNNGRRMYRTKRPTWARARRR